MSWHTTWWAWKFARRTRRPDAAVVCHVAVAVVGAPVVVGAPAVVVENVVCVAVAAFVAVFYRIFAFPKLSGEPTDEPAWEGRLWLDIYPIEAIPPKITITSITGHIVAFDVDCAPVWTF